MELEDGNVVKIAKEALGFLFKGWVPFVLNRGEIPSILNARGLVGEAAEIGVKFGQYSEYLLDHWHGKLLHSIDPWREFSSDEYHDEANVSQKAQERNHQTTTNRLARFGARSRILRLTSEEAAKTFEDNRLDFVYVDARHDYESVREDLKLWYSKVKPGGILAGHDYIDEQIGQTRFGVKQAVQEFAKTNRLRVKITIREPIYKSWLIFKTK